MMENEIGTASGDHLAVHVKLQEVRRIITERLSPFQPPAAKQAAMGSVVPAAKTGTTPDTFVSGGFGSFD